MEIFKKIFCALRKKDERESSPGESMAFARQGASAERNGRSQKSQATLNPFATIRRRRMLCPNY
jgi:hypothetical protein